MQLEYKKVSKDDIAAVTDLLSVLYEMPHDETLEENEKLFTDESQAFFLAFDENDGNGEKPVGVLHGSLRREYVNGSSGDLTGYIEAIYVIPEYRKRGIASGLIKTTERWMQINGCREVASDCFIENTDSRKFHLKIGFKETERAIFFLKKIEPVKYEIHPIDDSLREKIQPIIDKTWRAPFLAFNGKLWDSRTMPGYAAVSSGEILGYLLYEFHGVFECEIMLLHSIAQNIGIASALIEKIKQLAKERGAGKLIVQTSNDNIHAIKFYQKRKFTIRKIRLGALDIARKLKPAIPLIGKNDIPLRDEIEFEIKL